MNNESNNGNNGRLTKRKSKKTILMRHPNLTALFILTLMVMSIYF